MKKLFVLILTAALVLSAAACGREASPSGPEPQASRSESAEPVSPAAEPSGEETPSQPERAWDLKPGKVFHYNRPDTNHEGMEVSWELGTEQELKQFKELLQTADITYLEACDFTDTEAELPIETELEILEALENAEPGFFDKMENPATGGTYQIVACDREGKEIFSVGYDGFWFAVSIFGEGKIANYIFDGSGMELDLPSLEKYRSDSPFYGMDPGEILTMGDKRLKAPPREKRHFGTQEELDRWYELIRTAKITRLAVNKMNDTPGVLPVDVESQICFLLRNAEPALYPEGTKEDPATGGGITVIAYNGDEELFYITYIGNWFTVQFGGEDKLYIFNGEESDELNTLAALELEGYMVTVCPEEVPENRIS